VIICCRIKAAYTSRGVSSGPPLLPQALTYQPRRCSNASETNSSSTASSSSSPFDSRRLPVLDDDSLSLSAASSNRSSFSQSIAQSSTCPTTSSGRRVSSSGNEQDVECDPRGSAAQPRSSVDVLDWIASSNGSGTATPSLHSERQRYEFRLVRSNSVTNHRERKKHVRNSVAKFYQTSRHQHHLQQVYYLHQQQQPQQRHEFESFFSSLSTSSSSHGRSLNLVTSSSDARVKIGSSMLCTFEKTTADADCAEEVAAGADLPAVLARSCDKSQVLSHSTYARHDGDNSHETDATGRRHLEKVGIEVTINTTSTGLGSTCDRSDSAPFELTSSARRRQPTSSIDDRAPADFSFRGCCGGSGDGGSGIADTALGTAGDNATRDFMWFGSGAHAAVNDDRSGIERRISASPSDAAAISVAAASSSSSTMLDNVAESTAVWRPY
jgi:hypothetical protein